MSAGSRIREIRLRRKMSQSTLAGDLFNRSYISQIELGSVTPPLETLQLLALKLEIPLEELLMPSLLDQQHELHHLLTLAKQHKNLPLIVEVWEKSIQYAFSDLAIESILWVLSIEENSDRTHQMLLTTYNLLTRVTTSNALLWYELVFSLGKSYFHRQRYHESNHLFSAILISHPTHSIELRARINHATSLFCLAEYGSAAIQYEKSIQLIEKHGTPLQLAKCFHELGACHRYLKQLDCAYIYTKKAEEIYVGLDTARWHDAIHNLGIIFMLQGKYHEAKGMLEETLAFHLNLHNLLKAASVYEDLGNLAYMQHDFSTSLVFCNQSLLILEQHEQNSILYLRLLCLKYRNLRIKEPILANQILPTIKVLSNILSYDLKHIL